MSSRVSAVRRPRWRMRKDDDVEYQYRQARETVLFCLYEMFRPEKTKESAALSAQLDRDQFKGWSLGWEREQLLRLHAKKMSSRQLAMMFREVLPHGISPAVYYTLASSEVYIQKRKKEDKYRRVSTIYEISNLLNFVYMRLFQEKTTETFWTKRTVYIGRDIDGMNILKLVWKTSIIPNKESIKVYCPFHVYIGKIRRPWSLMRAEYVIVDESGRDQGVISMIGTRIPFLGPFSWMDERAVKYSVNTFDGSPPGSVHGDWPAFLKEPVFGVIFPREVGTLMKITLVAAGIFVFDDFFAKKMRDSVLPMDSEEYDATIREKIALERRKTNMSNLH